MERTEARSPPGSYPHVHAPNDLEPERLSRGTETAVIVIMVGSYDDRAGSMALFTYARRDAAPNWCGAMVGSWTCGRRVHIAPLLTVASLRCGRARGNALLDAQRAWRALEARRKLVAAPGRGQAWTYGLSLPVFAPIGLPKSDIGRGGT